MDLSDVKSGRWGLSRPLFDTVTFDGAPSGGYWSTYAALQSLAPEVQHFWPPLNADSSPKVNVVLVRLIGPVTDPIDGNTVLFPADITDIDVTLGDLTGAQRNALRSLVEGWLEPYEWADRQGTLKQVARFAATNYTNATTLREILRDVYLFLGHSKSRPVEPQEPESHNTEYLDYFTVDPASDRWTNEGESFTHDTTNDELDVNFTGSITISRYSANEVGSIEHEAQITGLGNQGRGPGAAVRVFNDGTNHCYNMDVSDIAAGVGTVAIVRSASTVLASATPAWTPNGGNFWWTTRIAASGAVGATVELRGWYVMHGLAVAFATKPNDPGWIGDDTVHDLTYSDTAADRHDESTNTQCGFASRSPSSDYDTRLSYFKQRAISDRVGIVVNDTALNPGNDDTGNITPAGTNRALLAAFFEDGATPVPAPSAVNFNTSEALTAVAGAVTAGTGDGIKAYARVAPTATTANIAASGGVGGWTGVGLAASGVNQTTPVADVQVAESAGATSRTATVPNCADGDLVWAFIAVNGDADAAASGVGYDGDMREVSAAAGWSQILITKRAHAGSMIIGASGWASARCSIIAGRIAQPQVGDWPHRHKTYGWARF